MVEFKAQKIHLKVEGEEKKLLLLLCFMSKNVYNTALYQLRGWYFKSKGRVLTMNTLLTRLKENENYKYLGFDWGDAIIMDAYKAFTKYVKFHNYDGTLKKCISKQTSQKDTSKFPHYLPKDGYRGFRSKGIKRDETNEYVILPLPEKIKNGSIFKDVIIDKQLREYIAKCGDVNITTFKIKIPENILKQAIRLIEIIPERNGNYIYASLLYPIILLEPKKERDDRIMGIDLGVNNLMTCVTTRGEAFIINGRSLKSVICLYNKKIAYHQSKLPVYEINNKFIYPKTKRLVSVNRRGFNRINDYINKAVALLYKIALEQDVRTIVIGWNEDFKEDVAKNPGDKTNGDQSKKNRILLKTPLAKLRSKIINKGKHLGIKVELVDESYTSQKSFYDNDSFSDNKCSGTRKERGLYITADGKRTVNADLNAALNILVKYSDKRNKPIKELEELRSKKILVPKIIQVKIG